MKILDLQYRHSLKIENDMVTKLNLYSRLVSPRYDFGNTKQVHQHKQMG
nr:hypothetical protein [uncultured Flavobacterium sp.]